MKQLKTGKTWNPLPPMSEKDGQKKLGYIYQTIRENKTHGIIYCPDIRKFHLELLFLTVLALPNASRTGFDCIHI